MFSYSTFHVVKLTMIKGGTKAVSNIRIREMSSGSLIINIPRDTAIRMGLKIGDRVTVTKEQ
jgi:hypothetical protein